jgi:hypothetical protein
MQYREFEKVLVETFSIDEASMGAFRARLRHLRNLGTPNIPKRGSGNAVNYRREHLFTTSIALALQTLGLAPVVSALVAQHAARQAHLLGSGKDAFLIVANFPAPKRGEMSDTPGFNQIGFRSSTWINNQFGGQTFACIVMGAEEAGKIATSTKTIACSLINLSERLKTLPGDV